MMLLNNILLIIIILLVNFACSQTKIEDSSAPTPIDHNKKTATSTNKNTPRIQPISVKDKLMLHYNEWNGVPYRYGGSNKTGIDCSGFVQLTYKKIFFKNIPRTTLSQSSIGQQISRQELTQGDLVFFKRSRSFRHVGIYLENGYFMHASTSRGVTISKLDSEYWEKLFWKAKRILDE